MIELLEKEKDGQVRLAVLDAIAALGHDAASAVPALVETLRTDVGGRGQEALASGLSFRPGAGGHWQTRGRGTGRLAEGTRRKACEPKSS